MENLGKLADFLCEGANVGTDIAKDKNFTQLGRLMDEGIALATVDWKALPEEAKNFDADVLSKRIEDKLDFSDDVLEAKVEKITKAVLKLSEIGLDLYEVFKPEEQAGPAA